MALMALCSSLHCQLQRYRAEGSGSTENQMMQKQEQMLPVNSKLDYLSFG